MVQTYEHTYAGVEPLASATLQSDNTVYARLSLDVGPANIVAMARKLGIRTSPLDARPVDRARQRAASRRSRRRRAYSTLAAGGVYSKPMAITKVILANGKSDTAAGWGKPQRERVIPDWVASTVTQVLEQNMLYGTGRGAHVSGRTDAGKTGTTDNYADAWFSGYTPRLEATVWIGYPRGEIPMLDVHGIAVSGPTFPADDLAPVHGDCRREPPQPALPASDHEAAVGGVARDVPVRGSCTAPPRPPRRRRRRARPG